MLLVKIRNSAALFWETLDDEERRVAIYVAVWLAFSVFATLRKMQREAFKREVIAEAHAQAVTADGSGS